MVKYEDAWTISDIDNSSDPEYYGFLRADGSWLIVENTGGTQFRYDTGTSEYSTNWTNRASLTYQYYNLEA
jgi:hypothetical protein